MRESSTAKALASTIVVEQRFKKNQFGTLVRALWPNKPAINLAQRIGCTERAAQFYIDGDRKPNAACVAIIVNEIFR